MSELALSVIHGWERLVFMYFALYSLLALALAALAFLRVRFFLQRRGVQDLETLRRSASTPAVTLIVPAFNEEQTLVASLGSLLALDYPAFEVVLVNDGSTDRTLALLVEAFGFRRAPALRPGRVPTAPIRALYEAPLPSGTSARRLLLVDKANGGKADALNAGLGIAETPYVCSVDADSWLTRDALLQTMHAIIHSRERVVVCGCQVGIANGRAVARGGTEAALPRSWLARFQLVEYMRSFMTGRLGLAALDSLLVLSGVFAVFEREALLDAGAFLTPRLTSRLVGEYSGARATVGEDMEIVVRLRRALHEKGERGRVLLLPFPVAWSQGPERIRDLAKQRDRWYRGLGQTLYFHRRMLGNPAYGVVGLFAMPYQLLFEFLGPLLEASAYLLLPVLYLAGLLSTEMLLLFFLVATLHGVVVSVVAVLLGLWTEGHAREGAGSESLFDYRRPASVAALLAFAALSICGYRQLQLAAQVRGCWSLVRGSQDWGKFARQRLSRDALTTSEV